MAWYENELIGRKRKSMHLAKQKIGFCQFRKKRNYNYFINVNEDGVKDKKFSLQKKRSKKTHNNHLLFQLFLGLFFTFSTLVLLYGVYLDYQIRSRIDGKIWQLPAAVYGRMVNLEPNAPVSKNEMVKLLKISQYHQTKKTTRPGEFSVHEKSIEMIRRPFDFPDNKEGQIRACLTFSNGHLITIKNMDTNRQFGYFRLDPRLITMLSSSNSEHRLFVSRNDFPDILVNILLTIEDRYFYKHDGVNFYSICRAILANISARHTIQGASTLTQQLVKNLFLTRKRSYWRKINEAYMALLMDAHYSKDRILELYMNEVYFGQSGDNEIRGFPLASLYYFGRPIRELSLDQQALLVGMVKGASIYNPWNNPKLALKRRNLVLHLLQQRGVLNKDACNMFITRPLGVLPRGGIISQQPAFMQMLRQELQRKLGDKIKNLSGVKIFTTFDYLAQDAAERAVSEGIPILRKQRNLKDLETAIVIVDRYSGEVRAMIGGADPQYAGYNRAMQARRSIGSLAKPATFLAALSQPNKYRLNTWIADEPISLHQSNGQIWSPQNDNRQFNCQVMLMDALTLSMNIPTVNLGMSIGLPVITDVWQKLGIPKEQLYPVPAMILGALNLIPIEVAQAFQTIANNGSRAPLSTLRSVIGEDGTVLYQSYPQAERTVPAQAAYMTMWSMQQVMQFGTGHQLGMKYPWLHLAGKTGTTNNSVDTWFVGIDGREVVITWVGRDNNQSTKLYGSNGAMSIYQRYLEKQFPVPLKLSPPENVIDMEIDESGNFVCSNGIRKVPVWTDDPIALRQNHQSEQLVGNIFHYSFQEQEQKNWKNSKEISDWIKDIFG